MFDTPYNGDRSTTPVMLALSNKQYHVVDWLTEQKKVISIQREFLNQNNHDRMDYQFARRYIGDNYWE